MLEQKSGDCTAIDSSATKEATYLINDICAVNQTAFEKSEIDEFMSRQNENSVSPANGVDDSSNVPLPIKRQTSTLLKSSVGKNVNKRKNIVSVASLLIVDEATDDDGECDDVDYAIVQNANKRQKIQINRRNMNNRPSADISHVNKENMSPKKFKEDVSGEPNKLQLKYDMIHANTVQKLTAQAEQLRLEITTLRAALTNEQNSVRFLR